jgi:RNA polymerase sigma factor (TIGR02999 family)
MSRSDPKTNTTEEWSNDAGEASAKLSPLGASEELWESVYVDLRHRARALLARDRLNLTLRPTEVVHEIWMRLANTTMPLSASRQDFFALVGRVMRHVLVDYARKRQTSRRGGNHLRIDIDQSFLFSDDNLPLVSEVDEILTRLAEGKPRLASVVELRFFAGLTETEIAEALNVAPRTVKRDWQMAKAWILAEINESHKR